MNPDPPPLCPSCRQPMVDIGKILFREDNVGEWGDFNEEKSDWDVPLGGDAEREQIWECPNCGHREYEF